MKYERHSLTSRQLAEVLGTSESSVKRWVDDGAIAADRTAGGHRRIPLAAAMGFIRHRRAALANPHALPMEAVPQIGDIDSPTVQEILEALQQDKPLVARSIISGRFLGGAGIAGISDNLIRPVMENLGELWLHRPDGIFLEHRAVDSILLALAEISAWLPVPPAAAPTAVSAGGPSDPYLLTPLLASLVLRECGIRAHNLGPCTPLETVGIAMRRSDAGLCTISLSAAPSARSEAAWLRLERQTTASGGKILVGGRCSAALPARVRDRVLLCCSMSDLSAYASGWLEGLRRTKPKSEKRGRS